MKKIKQKAADDGIAYMKPQKNPQRSYQNL